MLFPDICLDLGPEHGFNFGTYAWKRQGFAHLANAHLVLQEGLNNASWC